MPYLYIKFSLEANESDYVHTFLYVLASESSLVNIHNQNLLKKQHFLKAKNKVNIITLPIQPNDKNQKKTKKNSN